jgi:hypothetical protein
MKGTRFCRQSRLLLLHWRRFLPRRVPSRRRTRTRWRERQPLAQHLRRQPCPSATMLRAVPSRTSARSGSSSRTTPRPMRFTTPSCTQHPCLSQSHRHKIWSHSSPFSPPTVPSRPTNRCASFVCAPPTMRVVATCASRSEGKHALVARFPLPPHNIASRFPNDDRILLGGVWGKKQAPTSRVAVAQSAYVLTRAIVCALLPPRWWARRTSSAS